MKICVLGANGFIGSHLCEALLTKTPHTIFAADLVQDKLTTCFDYSNFQFAKIDILKESDRVKEYIQNADIVLPLAAIATPAAYVQNPLSVFELDFEANLAIVRLCEQFKKHLIFPSTSEVYGMCTDSEFDEETSMLITGPIHKERWIYSTSKQLLDRIIYSLGKHQGLSYTLFRPFNWYGPRLDNIHNPKPGGSRVLTQFIGNILREEPIKLVDGGTQKRCFTYITDGIDALLKIIDNSDETARNSIFNIGNPTENFSIAELAHQLIQKICDEHPRFSDKAKNTALISVDAKSYYGSGYQDVTLRIPSIMRAQEKLGWQPKINLTTGLEKTLDFYLK